MPHRAKEAPGFIIEWSPQWLTTDGQGSEKNQSPVAVIFTCRESVSGNRDAEKSFSCNFSRVPKAPLWALQTARLAALFPPGFASEQPLLAAKQ
jgi:hypothetical protein